MSRKKKVQSADPALQTTDITSRRGLIGVISAAVITAVAGIIVAFINRWLGNEKPRPTPDGAIYRVRVTVLDTQGIPTEEAKESKPTACFASLWAKYEHALRALRIVKLNALSVAQKPCRTVLASVSPCLRVKKKNAINRILGHS